MIVVPDFFSEGREDSESAAVHPKQAVWASRYLRRRCSAYQRGTLSMRSLRLSTRAMLRDGGAQEDAIRELLAEYGIDLNDVA